MTVPPRCSRSPTPGPDQHWANWSSTRPASPAATPPPRSRWPWGWCCGGGPPDCPAHRWPRRRWCPSRCSSATAAPTSAFTGSPTCLPLAGRRRRCRPRLRDPHLVTIRHSAQPSPADRRGPLALGCAAAALAAAVVAIAGNHHFPTSVAPARPTALASADVASLLAPLPRFSETLLGRRMEPLGLVIVATEIRMPREVEHRTEGRSSGSEWSVPARRASRKAKP